MGSSVETIQFICDQAELGKKLTYRKMFGEFALYFDGEVVALVCDDQLFLKPTSEGLAYLGKVTEAPPYPGARNFYLLSAEIDDTEMLGGALQITARALAARRRQPVRSPPASAGSAKQRRHPK